MEQKCNVLVVDSKQAIDVVYESKETIKSGLDRMTSSGASILDDTTPSDSGVQLLDSESSELNESLISSTGFDFDNTSNLVGDAKASLNDMLMLNQQQHDLDKNLLTKSDIANSNICDSLHSNHMQTNDTMISSVHSTFDEGNGENIVYRRRAKKTKTHSTPAPKKRVSFHEDILKNTKTDNIHIEHGFITYKIHPKKSSIGRYSWCSEGDSEDFNENTHVYRNACSDVLDYGKQTEVYENAASNYVHYDNSGVFEYGPQYNRGQGAEIGDINKTNPGEFYKCNCSDSNSSLDSGSSNSDENGSNYAQAKSYSCDCIGSSNSQNNNMLIAENCYYSEPSIEILDESLGNIRKSVWSKDKKPKSSCLKKSKRHTDILVECNINNKVKKFNVHPLTDMNNLIDNSKMIFGSLKNIFSIPLPERGVPEGSEDLQSVCECIPESETTTNVSPQKPRPFLSKSLDGGFKDIPKKGKENFVHNVDEQLRRKNDEDLYAPTRQNSRDFVIVSSKTVEDDDPDNETKDKTDFEIELEPPQKVEINYRNKFIINCESTVFEHTGISYCYEEDQSIEIPKTTTPVVSTSVNTNQSLFSAAPLKQKLTSIFKNLTTESNIDSDKNARKIVMSPVVSEKSIITPTTTKHDDSSMTQKISSSTAGNIMEVSITSSYSDNNSIVSDMTTTTTTSTTDQLYAVYKSKPKIEVTLSNSPRKVRHLASPAKKSLTTRLDRGRMSPDLFNNSSISGRESKSTMLSEEFDDILTITTSDTEKSDLVIVDYAALDIPTSSNVLHTNMDTSNNFLKPISSKSSLINRFLRNVTQKKIMDATIKKNTLFAKTVKSEKKLFNNLYPKNTKVNADKAAIMADFNAEIAMEIELSESVKNKSNISSSFASSCAIECDSIDKKLRIDIGVGEVPIEIFNGNYLHILRSTNEILMKAFKLYTGYNKDGYMTPVLVFLTDKTLYVTDLVRSRLCNKFVLPYSDLDVILVSILFYYFSDHIIHIHILLKYVCLFI